MPSDFNSLWLLHSGESTQMETMTSNDEKSCNGKMCHCAVTYRTIHRSRSCSNSNANIILAYKMDEEVQQGKE